MRVSTGLMMSLRAFAGPQLLVSTSNDVYTNLAAEDWIYSRIKDLNGPVLMLWRNQPCVVIGRHQNPWLECRLADVQRHGVQLARRNSGGGTVYHDLGNLNCTFFTLKEDYSRRTNLAFLCGALKAKWSSLDIGVSARDDILLQHTYKISGTAAKLGRCEAYHHCTILFHVNRRLLCDVLRNPATPLHGVDSKATRSVSSPVKNLSDVEPSINYDSLLEAITSHFQSHHQSCRAITVEPNEANFPGLGQLREGLSSWDWIYGRCPAFTITTSSTVLKVNRGVIDEATGFLKDYKGLRFPYQTTHQISNDFHSQAMELIDLYPQLF